MTVILQDQLPYNPFAAPRLPGIAPAVPGDWLRFDEAYAAQMARRCDLLERQRDDVLHLAPEAGEAAQELLDLVLDLGFGGVQNGGVQRDGAVTCPDGRSEAIDRADPLGTLGRLAQQDFCILQKPADQPRGEGEHRLTGAVLCFPASWRLAEKTGRPLTHIHDPVPDYDAGLARRVQRLFDGIQLDRPLWRFNALWYEDPELFQPRSAATPRPVRDLNSGSYLRSEQQTLFRLAKTGAVVFSIHTRVLTRARVFELWPLAEA